MLSRVAEDIFWMSRYVERSVAVSRLIDVTLHLELDIGDSDDDADLWAPLLGPAVAGGHLHLEDESHPQPREVRHHLAFNGENPNSLVSCVRRARAAARGVRESLSSEMWETLNSLYLSLVDPALMAEAQESPHSFFRRVREEAQFIHGLADCTLVRDEPWHFVTLGKYLERADSVARVLYLQAHLLVPSDPADATRGADPLVRWLAVLRSCGSAEAYARYYALRVEPARVVEFLLLNPIFPQSVRFSLGASWEALRAINERNNVSDDYSSPEVRTLGLLRAHLEHAAVDEILEEGLHAYLADVQHRIATISEFITRRYMRDDPQAPRLVAAARAAMIMAAQQQQQQHHESPRHPQDPPGLRRRGDRRRHGRPPRPTHRRPSALGASRVARLPLRLYPPLPGRLPQ
jgi:uncharacterized alpha-E superfamily protein